MTTETPSDLDTEPEPILERLLIPVGKRSRPGGSCVITAAHTFMGRRTFDVVGIPICEDCIRDIAGVVTELAAALELEA